MSREACALQTVLSRSDMIAHLHRNHCRTARERSSHSAAKQAPESSVFSFSGEPIFHENALINATLLRKNSYFFAILLFFTI